ncbi:MAG: acylphosphatase [Elusimicrobia bacterium]|nr:acylphosphatase [Elusimicrobiota bacterium]
MTVAKKKASLIVRGLVQGIGYRYFVQKTAGSFGLGGWVKNRPDGAVELQVEGEDEKIDEFIGALRHDHPWAKVKNVEIDWRPCNGEFKTFEITF